MVNNLPLRSLVHGACQVVIKQSGRLGIKNGPVYCLETAQKHLKDHGFFIINEKAQDAQLKEFIPELFDEELITFILALVNSDWVESERCDTTVGRTLDCDAYAMKWNRARRCRWEHAAKIYVKFGFADNHPKVLIVSIHPSKY